MISPFPSASTSPATTPCSSSAILPDSATFLREEGTHSAPEAGGAAAGGGAAGTGAETEGNGATAASAPAVAVCGAAAAEGTGGAPRGGREYRTAAFTPNTLSGRKSRV